MEEINLLDGNTEIMVDNMCGHRIGIFLQSSNQRRYFEPNVLMPMKVSEIRELNWQSGGNYMLLNQLRINNKDLAFEIGVPQDMKEYWWKEEDIRKALTTDPIEVLLDALDFGPEGIIEQLKNQAIQLEISDNRRIKAIQERTGADISAIIENNHAYDSNDDTNVKEKVTKRRVNAQGVTTRQRRVQD